MASPASTSRGPGALPILVGGAISSVATLALVWFLGRTIPDFNIMGWYANYVIPAGALIVGITAGAGYGLGSWLSGSRTTGAVVALVFHLQIAAYAGAQYIEFRDLDLRYEDGSRVGFLTYFDAASRSFAWNDRSGKPGVPLGGWGYAVRAMEIATPRRSRKRSPRSPGTPRPPPSCPSASRSGSCTARDAMKGDSRCSSSRGRATS